MPRGSCCQRRSVTRNFQISSLKDSLSVAQTVLSGHLTLCYGNLPQNDPIYRWLSYVKFSEKFQSYFLKYQTAIKMGVHGSQVTTNMATNSSQTLQNLSLPPTIHDRLPNAFWKLKWRAIHHLPMSMCFPHGFWHEIPIVSWWIPTTCTKHGFWIPWNPLWNPLWNHHEIPMKSPWNSSLAFEEWWRPPNIHRPPAHWAPIDLLMPGPDLVVR